MQDEYEDDEYEDYEDEVLEGEEEDELKQVEEQKPSREELEFLKLREKRKDRQKLKKQCAKVFVHSIQSQDSARTLTNAKFGSFFGPSQPVIASRVLDEGRSIRETQHVISKPLTSSGNGRGFASASSERKLSEHHQSLKVNEVKRKAQTLKDMQDYSFLKKSVRRRPDEDDDAHAIQMNRNMFQYNPSSYGMDDDDSDMEADFSQIEREEIKEEFSDCYEGE